MHRVAACDSLRARQTKGGPHAPENPTPTPAVNLRVNIEGLAKASKKRVVFLSARMKGSRSSSPWMRPRGGEDRKEV